MKIGKKFTTALIIGLLLLNVGLVTTIWLGDCNGPKGPHGNPPHGGLLFEKELGWDATQVAQFEALRAEHHKNMQGFHKELNVLKTQMLDLVTQESDDGLEEVLTKIGAKHADLDRITYEHFTAIRNICGPDKRGKFDELWQDIKGKLMPGPGGPEGRHGPPPPHGR